MNIIGNLTQHVASKEQIAEGVVEPSNKQLVKKILTFNALPYVLEIHDKAKNLVEIAKSEGWKAVMIGGAPYLMYDLEVCLRAENITPLYAFSKREVIEVIHPDGGVEKKSTFIHDGFITAMGRGFEVAR